MSELKDYSILDIEAIDDERLKKSESGRIQETRVYIKSEADKVIAEKDAEIAELKEKYKELAKLHDKAIQACCDADKVIASHKYKRCFGKAEMCESKVYHIRRTPLCDMSEHEYWQYENDFWQRWQIRWLELAYYLCEGGEVMIYAKEAK